MDENKRRNICGEKTTFGNTTMVCVRTSHVDIQRNVRRNHRDGINYFDEPPAKSHRFVNPARL